jgi:hypothetical protein
MLEGEVHGFDVNVKFVAGNYVVDGMIFNYQAVCTLGHG